MNITSKTPKINNYDILELINNSKIEVKKIDSINKNLIDESLKLEDEVQALTIYQGLEIE